MSAPSTHPAVVALVLAGAVLCSASGPAAGDPLFLGPGGRFRVEVAWRNPYVDGRAGTGRPHPIGTSTGAFWFFRPGNLEVVVKVLDGRPVNGRFWFFFTSLSTVELNLTVSDRETGWVRHYQDPAFAATTGLDAAAFGDEVPVGDLLFVGAHPDDELLLAPLLGELCGGPGRACTLLVATRGEAGTCRLPGGCGPDLGAVREDELRAAATQLGAELVSWRLPDVVGPDVAAVAAAWGSAAGGAEALVANLADELRRLRPAAVFAFDPRHGSTCHPAHRVAGDLVLAAVAELGSERPDLLWLETSVTGPPFHFAPVAVPDRRLRSWDASRPRAGGGTAWDHLLELAAVYRSQFDPARLASLAAVPPAERRVHLGRAADPPALSPAPCSAPPPGAPGMPRPGRP